MIQILSKIFAWEPSIVLIIKTSALTIQYAKGIIRAQAVQSVTRTKNITQKVKIYAFIAIKHI